MRATSSVPFRPVVEIEVSATGVTVDGEVVVSVDDLGSGPTPEEARRHAVVSVAHNVAQPLGRPVRAVAWEGNRQIWMIIHPDGAVTDVDDGSTVGLIARGWAAVTRSRRPTHAAERSPVGLFVTSGSARTLFVGVTLLILMLISSFGLQQLDLDGDSDSALPDGESRLDPTSPEVRGDWIAEMQPIGVTAHTTSGEGELRFVLRSTSPTPLRLIVDPEGDGPRVRRAVPKGRKIEVVVRDLPEGLARWTVWSGAGRITGGATQVLADSSSTVTPPSPFGPSTPDAGDDGGDTVTIGDNDGDSEGTQDDDNGGNTGGGTGGTGDPSDTGGSGDNGDPGSPTRPVDPTRPDLPLDSQR